MPTTDWIKRHPDPFVLEILVDFMTDHLGYLFFFSFHALNAGKCVLNLLIKRELRTPRPYA